MRHVAIIAVGVALAVAALAVSTNGRDDLGAVKIAADTPAAGPAILDHAAACAFQVRNDAFPVPFYVAPEAKPGLRLIFTEDRALHLLGIAAAGRGDPPPYHLRL